MANDPTEQSDLTTLIETLEEVVEQAEGRVTFEKMASCLSKAAPLFKKAHKLFNKEDGMQVVLVKKSGGRFKTTPYA